MLKFGNKEFRNLQEQVLKNMRDIQNVMQGATVLAEFGIKVIGQVDTAAELPNPATYEGEFGDAYIVGTQEPYEYYIFTRAFEGQDTPSWFDLGIFPVPGPQGPKGDTGDTGPQGQTGNPGTDGLSAGFGSVTASATTLEPGSEATVSVTTSGPNTEKSFVFTFGIPEGEPGVAPVYEWGNITGSISDQTDLITVLQGKQNTLVSGTNIKTINGSSILGSGNLSIQSSVALEYGDTTFDAPDILAKAKSGCPIYVQIDNEEGELQVFHLHTVVVNSDESQIQMFFINEFTNAAQTAAYMSQVKVLYSSGTITWTEPETLSIGGSTGVAWGSITGTLSNQTDLQQALNRKQATISDLSTIRAGAAAGATAVQPSDLAIVATSGSYNDLSDKPDLSNYVTTNTNQTIGGVKTFTGSNIYLNEFTIADGNDLSIYDENGSPGSISFSTDVYSLDLSPSTITGDRTIIIPDKSGTIAIDSEVVHKAGIETITGEKTFDTVTMDTLTVDGDLDANNIYAGDIHVNTLQNQSNSMEIVAGGQANGEVTISGIAQGGDIGGQIIFSPEGLSLDPDVDGIGGKLYIYSLPTSDPSETGALWSDNGNLVLSGYTPTYPVTDVRVNGTSVVSNKIANINTVEYIEITDSSVAADVYAEVEAKWPKVILKYTREGFDYYYEPALEDTANHYTFTHIDADILNVNNKISFDVDRIVVAQSAILKYYRNLTNDYTDLINKPDLSGYVTLSTAQSITGTKIFTEPISLGNTNHYIRKGTGNVVEIGANGSTILTLGSSSTAINSVLRANGDNVKDLGQPTVRWKDLYLAGSLKDGTNSLSVADIQPKLTAGTGIAISNNVISSTLEGIDYEVDSQLPASGQKGIIYLIPNGSSSSENIYNEYIWIPAETSGSTGRFEFIGTTQTDLSNYVTLSTSQTITGEKTFTGDTYLSGLVINDNSFILHNTTTDCEFEITGAPTLDRTITLPDKEGTVALTSDLANYVTLNTTQRIAGEKSFGNYVEIDKTNGYGELAILGDVSDNQPSFITFADTDYGITLGLGSIPDNDYEIYLPNKNGTLALTSDISTAISSQTKETWTFIVDDGQGGTTTVTKTVVLG